MYKVLSYRITLKHPSKTFSLMLPTSFQILGVDRSIVGLDVLFDARAPTESVKFYVAEEGEEIPLEVVRFKEHLGSLTIVSGRGADSLRPGGRYHIFGPRASGAFELSPNLRS